MAIQCLKQLERWKSSVSGCHMSWQQIKKIVILKCCLLLFYATTMNHFLIRLWRVTKSEFLWQPLTTSAVVGLRRSSKALPKAKLAPKRGHGHCLVVCCPPDPLQFSESWWNHYIWEVCSVKQWATWKTATPAAGIGQQKGPNSSPWQRPTAYHTMNVLKVVEIGLWSLASSSIFTWPLANWLPLLQVSRQLFAGKMLPQPARGRKCFPRVHWIPKHGFL